MRAWRPARAGEVVVDSLAAAAPLLRSAPAWVWIVLVWAVISLPNLAVRSFVWEEGNNAAMARDVLDRGNFLEPEIFGLRWAEKPALLVWLIAGTARLTGQVDEWSARLPSMLAVLATALLVHRVARRYASAPAALFAAGAFMVSPMLLRKLRIAEPDTLITFLSFAAFLVWWNGEARGRVTAWRWLACGGLLTVLAMAKGPQPVAFFALGVGGYLLLRRAWTSLAGLALCLSLPAAATLAWAAAVHREGDLAVWFHYLRLHDLRFTVRHYLRERARFAIGVPIDLLPSTLLVPSILLAWRRHDRAGGASGPILSALALYAGLCTLALLAWPGTKTRYAMPIAPAVAVLAGLALESVARRRRWLAGVALATTAGLFVYQAVLVTVVTPLLADTLGAARRRGADIDAVIGAAPAPVFTLGKPQSNRLVYVSYPVRIVTARDVPLPVPAWVFARRSEVTSVAMLGQDLVVREVSQTVTGPGLVLLRIERRPSAPGSEGRRRRRPSITGPASWCWRSCRRRSSVPSRRSPPASSGSGCRPTRAPRAAPRPSERCCRRPVGGPG
jgi:4-amino-4-deoxy-L-arabinose transferase-like glycosyltransferase